MAVLVVVPRGSLDSDGGCTPLGRSLDSQTVDRWRLAPNPSGDPEPDELQPDDVVLDLPVDTRLSSSACETILRSFAEHPEAVALYGDRLVAGRRQARPAWSPTRVQSEPGACLPLAVRASWARPDPSWAPLDQERRLAESNAPVLHVPSVLTLHPGRPSPDNETTHPNHPSPDNATTHSNHPSPDNETTHPNHPPPDNETTHPNHPSPDNEATTDDPRFEPGGRSGTRRRRPSSRGQASTSIIIPSAGVSPVGATRSMLSRGLETLALLDPPPLEVIVVIGDEFRGEPPQEENPGRNGPAVRVLHRGPGDFDFSRAINRGLLACRGELVLMLNDDIEAETSDWLGRMAAHLDDPTVGAVGAALLYPDRTVQHVGMVIDDGHPMHPFKHYQLADTAAHGGDVARDVIGVTGACLLARRRDLLAAGGLSPEYPVSYGDIDLCLRFIRTGLRVVVEPAAVLIHHESASRETIIEPWEWNRFIHRWGEVRDPWYHPGFRRPNHPDHRNRNADHLDPDSTEGSWPARSTAVHSRMHRSWVNLPWEPPL